MRATMRSRVEAVAREAPPLIPDAERANNEYRPNPPVDATRPHRAKLADARILVADTPLNDVGMSGVAERIPLKPGGLTTEEFSDMKRHTVIGADLLAGGVSEVETMAEAIARFHHERWDGNAADTSIPE
jgi:hypothetical protein